MRFYEKHIGDFNNATRHLSRIERSIYQDLIELYYDTENPLPDDLVWINKRILAITPEEQEVTLAMLNEFFSLEDGQYVNKRCEKTLAEYRVIQAKIDEKRQSEADRQRRYREKRSNLFKELKDLGENPPYNTPNNELESMLSRVTKRKHTKQDTANQQTTTQQPSTSNQGQQIPFAEFWELYPKKVKRKKAAEIWHRRKFDEKEFSKIKAHLSIAFKDREKKFIPDPTTYLNNDGWEDEIIADKPKGLDLSKIPNEALWNFAKQHGLPDPGRLDYFQYRSLLKSEIEKRGL